MFITCYKCYFIPFFFFQNLFDTNYFCSIAFCNRSCSGLESGPKSYGQNPTSLSKEPSPDSLPQKDDLPALKVCQVSDNKLCLPRDIRQMFLQCPIYGPEWRSLLKEFDAQWGVPASDGSPTPRSSANPNGTPSPVKDEVKMEKDEFDWSTAFPDEPKTMDAIKQKYGQDITEMPGHDPNVTFVLVPGPALFVTVKEAMVLKNAAINGPIVAHGAGVWLLGDKADKFKKDNPNRGIPCSWHNDEGWVVMEEWALPKLGGCGFL